MGLKRGKRHEISLSLYNAPRKGHVRTSLGIGPSPCTNVIAVQADSDNQVVITALEKKKKQGRGKDPKGRGGVEF